MSLEDQLKADLTTSMKSGQRERTDALRLLRAAIQKFRVDRTDPKNPQHGNEITEDDILGVVQKEIKQRRDSIEQFEKGNRADLAAKEQVELDIFQTYLPKQLTREEIVAAIQPLIEREGKDFRKIMPLASKELKGKAEGRLINEVVKELTA
jgi:uncharacterized protein YqeY